MSIMGRRVLMVEVSGWRVRGRKRLGWIDFVKVALGNTGMTVLLCAKDGKIFRDNERKIGKSGEPWCICN